MSSNKKSGKITSSLSKKREEIAEGIAVGIYSLFAGLKLQDDFIYLPKGKKINFDKYKISGSNTYFNEAVSY